MSSRARTYVALSSFAKCRRKIFKEKRKTLKVKKIVKDQERTDRAQIDVFKSRVCSIYPTGWRTLEEVAIAKFYRACRPG